jgi:hypothetical protein
MDVQEFDSSRESAIKALIQKLDTEYPIPRVEDIALLPPRDGETREDYKKRVFGNRPPFEEWYKEVFGDIETAIRNAMVSKEIEEMTNSD